MGVWEKMPETFHDALDKCYQFESPRKHGYDVVETIDHMLTGDIKALICLGGNFLSASPDTKQTRKAIEQCDLTVQISTKLNRSHAVAGKTALILPCLVRSEIDARENGEDQIITTENSMGVIQSSQGHNKPVSNDLLSETQIVCGIAKASLEPKWQTIFSKYTENYDEIRNDIEKVIPGFDNFNERVRKPSGFYLPNGPRDREFTTTSGMAEFTVNELPDKRLEEGQLMLQTLRTHDQYNTTVYGMEDRYRGLYYDRDIIMMNKNDLQDRDLKHGDKVNITSHFQGETRDLHNFTAVEYSMPSGACAAYFPEANVLVPLHKTAKESNTPTSKAIPITVEKANP